MKIMLAACAILIAVFDRADALPFEPYVGLYRGRGSFDNVASTCGAFTPFQLWIWWLPSEHGLHRDGTFTI